MKQTKDKDERQLKKKVIIIVPTTMTKMNSKTPESEIRKAEIDLGIQDETTLLVGSHNKIIIEKLYGPTCVKPLIIVWEGSDWNLRKAFDKGINKALASQKENNAPETQVRFLSKPKPTTRVSNLGVSSNGQDTGNSDLKKEILDKCAREEGYMDYEELTILHDNCSKATKIYEKAVEYALQQGKLQALASQKEKVENVINELLIKYKKVKYKSMEARVMNFYRRRLLEEVKDKIFGEAEQVKK